MIRVKIHRTEGAVTGFSVDGHAGYADKGEDIVCAAVSVLAVNTVNSIESFTKDHMDVTDGDGLLDVKFTGTLSDASELLINSFLLGVRGVVEEYGTEFIRLEE